MGFFVYVFIFFVYVHFLCSYYCHGSVYVKCMTLEILRDPWASSGGHAVLHHLMLGPPSQLAERPGLSAIFNFISNQVLILVLLVSQVRQHLGYPSLHNFIFLQSKSPPPVMIRSA